MKKRLFLLALVSLFGLSLSSCSKNNSHISLLYYDSNDTFLSHMNDSLVSKLESNYSYSVSYAEKSQLTQNQQIEDNLKNTDLLLMNMVDRLASGAVVEKCMKKNVPIIFFNREPLLRDISVYENCYYVGPNPYQQGQLQVNCASELFGNPNSLNEEYDLNKDNKIQLIILKGEQSHQDAEQRTQACISTLIQRGYDVELLGISVCNWSREEAYNTVWNKYQDYFSKAELILSNNDEMAIGAANYLKSVALDDEKIIPIIGVDATAEGIKAVNDGLLASTVVNDSDSQVNAILELADILLNKEREISEYSYPITNAKYIYINSYIYNKQEK